MIDNYIGAEVVTLSALLNNETVLVSVVCSFEHDVQIICEICGKEEVVKINRLFKQLRSISVQENSLIKTKDKKVINEIEKMIKANLERDICQECNEEEIRFERQKYLPTDPLRI
jgi:hypothetical protein